MRIVFMGTPKAAVPSLERLLADAHEVVAVYTQPDRPSGRGNKITFSPVKECALEHKILVFQPTKIRTAEALEEYRSLAADIAVVVAYGRILPETFLTAFPKGAINVHFSLLPKYRGAAPVNWAIVNGEGETGVTTMQMDVGLDTGDILLQRATVIGADENAIGLMERLSAIGAELLSETLTDLDNLKPIKQDESAATFAPIMKREDGLMDWKKAAGEIANRVRGFQPFPASFTFIDKAKLTIWQANLSETTSNAPPGSVLTAYGDIFEVACGDGSVLAIGEVQPEGKRRMSVRDFLNGAKPKIGTILGE
ncbi:MAG TPA: methionyl-tRNA formyltransferase [Pyrinomonadaceae bacterium]|nr:methionyl-tRNA formyltransferase [Pyrinomonadaceae bacterium]